MFHSPFAPFLRWNRLIVLLAKINVEIGCPADEVEGAGLVVDVCKPLEQGGRFQLVLLSQVFSVEQGSELGETKHAALKGVPVQAPVQLVVGRVKLAQCCHHHKKLLPSRQCPKQGSILGTTHAVNGKPRESAKNGRIANALIHN